MPSSPCTGSRRGIALLGLLLALCACAGRGSSEEGAAPIRVQSTHPVRSVSRVRIAGGFDSMDATTLQLRTSHDGLLIEVDDVEYHPPRAGSSPDLLVDALFPRKLYADMLQVVGPVLLLVPEPARGTTLTVWETDGFSFPPYAPASLDTARRKVIARGGLHTVLVPSPTASPAREYPTLKHLELEVAPVRLTREGCREYLGKECGVLLEEQGGPFICGPCPSSQVCTLDNRCCMPGPDGCRR